MKVLFYGGEIVTLAQPEQPQALLVSGETIEAVGDLARLRERAGDCREVNLQGRTLVPGLIDAHSHFSQLATAQLQAELEGAQTVEEIRERIRDFAKAVPAGQWVTGRGLGNLSLTLEELDSFAPGHPLVLHHQSGHMGYVNSLGLQELSITPDTPDPEGGKIGREGGRLTGYLEENAFVSSLRRIPLPSLDQLLRGYEQAQQIYFSHGITTFQDGMVVKELLPIYQALEKQPWLKGDAVAYAGTEDYDRFSQVLPETGSLTLGGMKIFLDGSPQGRTAWMRKPYADDPEYRGYGTMTDEAVISAMTAAGERNTQLLCHCNGDAASEQFLRCLEQSEKTCPQLKNLRPVIIHGQLLGRDQLARVKQLGAVVSFFVAHVYHWGDLHRKNFGEERAAAISPVRSALEAGVPVTFHTDAPVIAPDLLETIWCAVNRRTKEGFLLGPEERVSPRQALEAVTQTAAWQYFQEEKKGTLEPGKQADFAVLSENPLTAPPENIREIQVLETWVRGEKVYSRR